MNRAILELSEYQYDALRELINIGVGKAANIMHMMVNKHIVLRVPKIFFVDVEHLKGEIDPVGDEMLSSVNLPFRGNLSGSARLIFPTDSAAKIVSIFTDENVDESELDAIRVGTLSEIGNIVLNSLIGTVSNFLDLDLQYSIPVYFEGDVNQLVDQKPDDPSKYILLARTSFLIEELEITGDFVLFLELGSMEKLLQLIDTFKFKTE